MQNLGGRLRRRDGDVRGRRFTSVILGEAAVEKVVEKDVEHIRGIFGVDASTAGLLLRHMSWDKEPRCSWPLAPPSPSRNPVGRAAKVAHKSETFVWRCIANALLLIERARTVFVSKEVNGGEICIYLLQKPTNPDQIFILACILFLATVSPSPFITTLVEEKRQGHLAIETSPENSISSSFRCFPAAEKKVLGDWSPKLDPCDAASSHLSSASSTRCPKHPRACLRPAHACNSLSRHHPTRPPRSDWFLLTQCRLASPSRRHPVVPAPWRLHSSSSGSGNTGTPTHTSPRPNTLDRALSVPTATWSSLSRSPSSIPLSAGGGKDKGKSAAALDTLIRVRPLSHVHAALHVRLAVTQAPSADTGSDIKDESSVEYMRSKPEEVDPFSMHATTYYTPQALIPAAPPDPRRKRWGWGWGKRRNPRFDDLPRADLLFLVWAEYFLPKSSS
ncbi:hypothetical protein B0H11DRAFT_2374697 [Mycena galericulata]|nr:hypothetical protein B0H11DRAFT_2374697 [Mycena galericulata]